MQASASPEQFTTFIASDIPRSAKAMREAGLLMRFSETPGVIRRPSPLLGEHTREVLTQMGVSEAEQLALKDKKVVSWPG